MTKIAWMGLGAMGQRMVQRLLSAGFDVTVTNRTRARAEALEDAGARWADSPAEAARGADVVVSMVTDDDASRAVWLDPERGALVGLDAGALAVESSTLTPGWVTELSGAVQARGGQLLDAPVVGSRPQADQGRLIVLAGGAPDVLDRARPVLSAYAGAIHHAGGAPGAGAWAKLAVNALFSAQVAALSEVLGTLQRAGVTPDAAVALLGEIPITSPAMRGIGGLIAKGVFAPAFPIDLVEKDLRYAQDAARSVGAATPVIDATRAVYQRAQTEGIGGLNVHGVAKLYLDDSTTA